MVAAAAALVLLVACANVANLILVRADGRQRELAVREAIGAGRLARAAAFPLRVRHPRGNRRRGGAWLSRGSRFARSLRAGPAEIPRLAEVRIDAATVLVALTISALVAVACSIIPALRIGRVHLANALREGGRGGTAGRAQHRVRGTMVAVQIALALVVLSGLRSAAAVLPAAQRGPTRLRRRECRDVLDVAPASALPVRHSRSCSFYSQLTERVAELPGVSSVGLTSRLPFVARGMNQNPFYAEDDPTSATKIPPLQIFTTIDAGYFSTMKIPLLAGRTFDRLGVQREGEAIISQRTAEQFWKDPTGRAAIGKRFRPLPSGPWTTIIGVVGNARDTSLAVEPSQTVYFPQVMAPDTLFGNAQRTMALVVKTAGVQPSITSAVQRVVRELDPTLPTFDVRPMTEVMRASMAQLSFTILILGAAAVVTLLLGAIGLYGVMAYLVTLRTRELGVRIALGAQPSAVAAMMTGQGLALTAAGIVAGLGIFAIVARFLRSFLFGVAPSDPLTLGAASLILVAIAALASWIPARRASRVDPANTLRAE